MSISQYLQNFCMPPLHIILYFQRHVVSFSPSILPCPSLWSIRGNTSLHYHNLSWSMKAFPGGRGGHYGAILEVPKCENGQKVTKILANSGKIVLFMKITLFFVCRKTNLFSKWIPWQTLRIAIFSEKIVCCFSKNFFLKKLLHPHFYYHIVVCKDHQTSSLWYLCPAYTSSISFASWLGQFIW